MADKFGITDHCIELFEECMCKGGQGTGHFLLLEPKSEEESRVAGGYACNKCFGDGGQSPYRVGTWVGKTTKKPWDKVTISDLVAIKKVFKKQDTERLIQYNSVYTKRDTSERGI